MNMLKCEYDDVKDNRTKTTWWGDYRIQLLCMNETLHPQESAPPWTHRGEYRSCPSCVRSYRIADFVPLSGNASSHHLAGTAAGQQGYACSWACAQPIWGRTGLRIMWIHAFQSRPRENEIKVMGIVKISPAYSIGQNERIASEIISATHHLLYHYSLLPGTYQGLAYKGDAERASIIFGNPFLK